MNIHTATKQQKRPGRACLLKLMLCGVLLVTTTGCAFNPASKTAMAGSAINTNADLYDGKSTTTFATQLPVSSAEEARMRGDDALRKGDVDLALYQYIQALELDSKDIRTLTKIGAIHTSRGNLRLAEIAYRRTLKIASDDPTALTGLGLILVKNRETDSAYEMLYNSVSVQPVQWRAYNALGILADIDGNHMEAVEHYKKALGINPDSPKLMNNLGYSYYLANDRLQAATHFKRALDKNPKYKLAWRNLGLIYARQGKYPAAVNALSKTMDLSMAYNDVGYLSMLDKKYEVSEAYLKEAVNVSPSYYKTAKQNIVHVRTLKSESDARSYDKKPVARKTPVKKKTAIIIKPPMKSVAHQIAKDSTLKKTDRPEAQVTLEAAIASEGDGNSDRNKGKPVSRALASTE